MKTMVTFLMLILFGITNAQDKIYVHTATVANIGSNATYIDHPDLNENPSAKILIAHNATPNGSGSATINDHISGVFYDSGYSKWAIINQDETDMIIGSSYNVYIADNDNVITHISSAANQGSDGAFETVIDNPDFNGSIGPYAVFTPYFNPFSVYNNINYGFYFDVALDKRGIYAENGTSAIPTFAAFFILKSGDTSVITRYTHSVDAGNIGPYYTILDNPNLNNNPEATFVFAHYWGVNGTSSEENINATLGVMYNSGGGRWIIYSEDTTTPIPEGTAFDIIVANQEILGNEDFELNPTISMYPNPARVQTTIATTEEISSIKIFNLLGQEILQIHGNGKTMQLDLSAFTAGNYIIKVQTESTANTLKLIKL